MNGMTIALAPELCMPLLGAISDGVSDIDFMLRIGLFGHFTVSGIFPTVQEQNAATRERWRHTIELYKSFVRPMLSTCRLFHHTPIQRQTEEGDWVVLECMDDDSSRGYTGIFRLGGAKEDAYHFYPKGLDISKRYRVTYDTRGQSQECEGGTLANQGLRVAVPSAFTSELLLFEVV
jgi:hypothetical protein